MIKYTIVNLLTNETYYPILNSVDELDTLLTTNEVLYGKKARWIELNAASDFEKSREDNRQETNGIIEIHVPNDFTIASTDVTSDNIKRIKKAQNVAKRQLCQDLIVDIDVNLLDDLELEQKVAISSDLSIQEILMWINNGSLIEVQPMIEALEVNEYITAEFKQGVLDLLAQKVALFNSMSF